MTWIKERHRVWRIAIFLMLLVTFLGPWIFDGIYVPPEYFCSPPNIRLDDYFCGVPMPVTWLYRWVVRSFMYSSSGLVTGEFVFTEWIREFLYSLFIFLPLLPVFSTLLLILR